MPLERDCETGKQVLGLKAGVWMKLAESGRGWGVEASIESKTHHRMTRQHPFLNMSCSNR